MNYKAKRERKRKMKKEGRKKEKKEGKGPKKQREIKKRKKREERRTHRARGLCRIREIKYGEERTSGFSFQYQLNRLWSTFPSREEGQHVTYHKVHMHE